MASSVPVILTLFTIILMCALGAECLTRPKKGGKGEESGGAGEIIPYLRLPLPTPGTTVDCAFLTVGNYGENLPSGEENANALRQVCLTYGKCQGPCPASPAPDDNYCYPNSDYSGCTCLKNCWELTYPAGDPGYCYRFSYYCDPKDPTNSAKWCRQKKKEVPSDTNKCACPPL